MRIAAVIVTAAMVSAASQAQAAHDLDRISCAYRDSICELNDFMQQDRYASRYVVMYVDRLHRSACELHTRILADPFCPRVQVQFDEVCAVHARVSYFLTQSCRSNPNTLALWRPVECAMTDLRQAMLVLQHPPQRAPVIRRRISIDYGHVVPQPNPRYGVAPNEIYRGHVPYSVETQPQPRYRIDQQRLSRQQSISSQEILNRLISSWLN